MYLNNTQAQTKTITEHVHVQSSQRICSHTHRQCESMCSGLERQTEIERNREKCILLNWLCKGVVCMYTVKRTSDSSRWPWTTSKETFAIEEFNCEFSQQLCYYFGRCRVRLKRILLNFKGYARFLRFLSFRPKKASCRLGDLGHAEQTLRIFAMDLRSFYLHRCC